MKRWKRTSPIRQLVVHVNVGPETPVTSADDLADYLDSIVGGYHHVHDDDSTVTLARDDECVAGAKGGDCNEVAIHHCIIGRADQTDAQWHDTFSKAAIARCAKSVASDCAAHGINAVHIVGPAIRDKARTGICGHGDVTVAWKVSGGHTDPGPAFPWPEFITLVESHLHPAHPAPAPPPSPVPLPAAKESTMLEQPLRPNETQRDPTRPQVARVEYAAHDVIWLHNGASVAGDTPFKDGLRYLRIPTAPDNPIVDLVKIDGPYGVAGFTVVTTQGHGHPRVWS